MGRQGPGDPALLACSVTRRAAAGAEIPQNCATLAAPLPESEIMLSGETAWCPCSYSNFIAAVTTRLKRPRCMWSERFDDSMPKHRVFVGHRPESRHTLRRLAASSLGAENGPRFAPITAPQRPSLAHSWLFPSAERRRTARFLAMPSERKIPAIQGLTVWCGREDSNFHGLSPTTTSTLRVYQFRHDRTRVLSGQPKRWSRR